MPVPDPPPDIEDRRSSPIRRQESTGSPVFRVTVIVTTLAVFAGSLAFVARSFGRGPGGPVPGAIQSGSTLPPAGSVHLSFPPRYGAASGTPGVLWVSGQGGVAEVNPASGTVPLSESLPGWNGPIAVGVGSVWVLTAEQLVRIDAATGKIVAAIPVVGTDVVVGDGAVWIAGVNGDSVDRVDPGTNSVVAQIGLNCGSDCQLYAIAYGAGAVWVESGLSGSVYKIDPASDQLVDTIPNVVGPHADGIVVSGTTLWAANGVEGQVTKVDTTTDGVTGQISICGASPVSCSGGPASIQLTAALGAVWALSSDGSLLRIDPVTGLVSLIDRFAPAPGTAVPEVVTIVGASDALWGLQPALSSVATIPPTPQPAPSPTGPQPGPSAS